MVKSGYHSHMPQRILKDGTVRRMCGNCLKWFEPKVWNQKFCCKGCAESYRRSLRKVRNIVKRQRGVQ